MKISDPNIIIITIEGDGVALGGGGEPIGGCVQDQLYSRYSLGPDPPNCVGCKSCVSCKKMHFQKAVKIKISSGFWSKRRPLSIDSQDQPFLCAKRGKNENINGRA